MGAFPGSLGQTVRPVRSGDDQVDVGSATKQSWGGVC